MTTRLYEAPAALILALCVSALGACEEHRSPAVANAPEILHEALTGDTAAQASLAACYEKGGCLGIAPDAAMACAWRGVRLASHAADLSLADNSAFELACASSDETFRQRSILAIADLTTRVYGQSSGDRASTTQPPAAQTLLYPAMETVRTRLNFELARASASERLPPFGRAASTGGDAIAWSTCAGAVCLAGQAPSFGGGISGYRVTVSPAAQGQVQAAALAGRLAAAGLDTPSGASMLSGPQAREFVLGPVCWRTGQDDHGVRYAAASRAPCRAL